MATRAKKAKEIKNDGRVALCTVPEMPPRRLDQPGFTHRAWVPRLRRASSRGHRGRARTPRATRGCSPGEPPGPMGLGCRAPISCSCS